MNNINHRRFDIEATTYISGLLSDIQQAKQSGQIKLSDALVHHASALNQRLTSALDQISEATEKQAKVQRVKPKFSPS